MKIILHLVLASLLFTGCTSVYTTKTFTSKKSFEQSFNNDGSGNLLSVTLRNDSSFIVEKGSILKDDTLSVSIISVLKILRKEPTGNIGSIDYGTANFGSATIQLKDGEKLAAGDMSFTKDTVYFADMKTLHAREYYPVEKIKFVQYKNHAAGIIQGGYVGAIIGACIGYSLGKRVSDEYGSGTQAGPGVILGACAGLLTGGLTGYIIGYTYRYEF